MSRGLATGLVVLDCEGLARAARRDLYLRAVIEEAAAARTPVAISAVTLVEAMYPKIDRAALRWTVSRLVVVPATQEIAAVASDLLAHTDRHGHEHALDALVCATALSRPGHPTIYTSGPGDMRALVGSRATVVPLD